MDKLVQVKWEIVDGERFFSIGVAYISEIENRDRLAHGGGKATRKKLDCPR